MARCTLSVPILWHVTVVLKALPASWVAGTVETIIPVCVATSFVTATVVSIDANCHITPFGHQHIRRRNLTLVHSLKTKLLLTSSLAFLVMLQLQLLHLLLFLFRLKGVFLVFQTDHSSTQALQVGLKLVSQWQNCKHHKHGRCTFAHSLEEIVLVPHIKLLRSILANPRSILISLRKLGTNLYESLYRRVT